MGNAGSCESDATQLLDADQADAYIRSPTAEQHVDDRFLRICGGVFYRLPVNRWEDFCAGKNGTENVSRIGGLPNTYKLSVPPDHIITVTLVTHDELEDVRFRGQKMLCLRPAFVYHTS